jgi:hypothetical protein
MSRLDELMAEAAETQRAALERMNLQVAVAAGLERRLATRPAPSWRGFAIGTAVAAAAVVLFAVGARRERGSTLTFDVDDPGHPGRRGDVIAPGAGGPASIVFSDGSRVVVAANASARVDALDAEGATVTVVDGVIDARVVHRARTHWQVRAGDFRVQVTGTRFAVEWHAGAATVLDVRLYEGLVEVDGPGLTKGTTSRVLAGQRLHVGAGGRELHDDVPTTDGSARQMPAPRPGAAAPAMGSAGKAIALNSPSLDSGGARARFARRNGAAASPTIAAPVPSPATAPAPVADWRELATHARYHEALQAAVAGGDFEGKLQRLSGDDLLLLGDVARLDGDVTRANGAYGAALNRFPGSAATDRATFSLGVIAFEMRHDYAGAARWFDRTLHEHPKGPLATEAAGRLMEALARSGDSARAHAVARAYLREHPKGPHAALAQRIDAGP